MSYDLPTIRCPSVREPALSLSVFSISQDRNFEYRGNLGFLSLIRCGEQRRKIEPISVVSTDESASLPLTPPGEPFTIILRDIVS